MKRVNVEILQRRLSYCPTVGVLRWKDGPRAGRVAGTVDNAGYRWVNVNGKPLAAHRVAWALYFGAMPLLDIDHLNRRRDDNRIRNLREVTKHQNAQNRVRRRR